MSEPTLRPIWTPYDAMQTAARHTPYLGVPDQMVAAGVVEPDMLPFRRPAGSTCECCGARPEESCEHGCLNLMTDDEQRAHRDEVIDNALAELGDDIGVEAPPPMPDEYLAQVALYADEYAGRRRSRLHFARCSFQSAGTVLMLVGGALAGVGIGALVLAVGLTAAAWIAVAVSVLVLIVGAVDHVRTHP